ncbi:MAG: hypothetical protein KDI01_11810, partial [Halioglobus sp.]|nr:hypothetical protein [Halioglobus sp.]
MNGWNGIEPHIWGGRFNRVRISVLILAAVMVFPVLASDSVRLNARFWDMPMATSGGEPMTRASVPELDDASIREGSGGDLPDPDKPLLGVAISGGGTRSASAAMGQLRALIRLGWFEDVDYLSTVSGGTWASWPFTFLPDAISDQHYLGRYIAPEDLTEADLTDEFPARSLGYAITHAKWRKQALMGWISGRGDETFAYVLGEHFLRNVGLNDRKKLFAFDREQVDHIVTRHRQGCVLPGDEPLSRKCLELGPESFYTTRPGRPFHIANSTVLPNLASQSLLNRMDSLNPSDLFRSIASDSGHEATATSGGEALIALNPAFVYPLEITPIYTGTRSGDTILHGPLGHQGSVGGLLVESYSYDSRALHVPAPNSGPGSSSSSGYVSEYKSTFLGKYRQSRYHFTHSDVLAASGAAPQEVLSALGLRNIGFPEFVHSSRHGAGRLTSREFSHGDGGHADNIGLPALLA